MSSDIHPSAVVDPRAQIHEGVTIGPFCVVGPGVILRRNVRLISHVAMSGNVDLGEGSTIYPFATLGHPPQDLKYRGGETWLRLGSNNVVRENVTMHPGTEAGRGETSIGENGFFMVGAHVAHDCRLGDHVIMTNLSTMGGHCDIGSFVTIAGLAGIHQFCRIGHHAFIGGMARVATDVIPYGMAVGHDAHLFGLNIVGLRRRGFSNATIQELRAAYRLLFAEEGTFSERLADAHRVYLDKPEVMEILNFISAGANRSLCMPK